MKGNDRAVFLGGAGGRVLLMLLALCLALALFPGIPATGTAEEGGLRMRVSKDALWYTGSDPMRLQVILENPGTQTISGVSMVFRLYAPYAKRTELADFRNGKSRRTRESRALESGLKLDPGSRRMEYSVDIPSLGLAEGAWPYSVEASRNGVKLAEQKGCLLIQKAVHGQPLGLMPLWEMHFPPEADALGAPVESGLAAAFSEEAGREGFVYSLLSTIERHPGVKTTLASSSESLQSLMGAAVAASGQAIADDAPADQAGGMAEAAGFLRRSVEGGHLYLLSSSYAYADLDQLVRKGWREDAREQVSRGLKGLGELMSAGGATGFFPPRYGLGPEVLGLLAEQGVGFTIAPERSLAATQQGAALVPAARQGYPVKLSAGEAGSLDAWVADEQIYAYLAGVGEESSGQEVVENLLAETFLLQEEKPAEKRACLLAFPESFQPDGPLLGQLYDSLAVVPWVETVFPDSALSAVPSQQGQPVPLEPVESPFPPLFSQLESTRDLTLSYRELLFEENPLREELYLELLRAENADLYLEDSLPQGEQVLEDLSNLVLGEMAGIQVQERGTVTLASTKGELTVVVSNLNDYPVKAYLNLSDTSVSFPQGSRREVVINPQDNRFKFDVETSRKGSFLLDIVLTGDGLEISRSTVNLRTSSLNTLALTFLAILLGALLLALLLRKMRHWGRRGKHEHS